MTKPTPSGSNIPTTLKERSDAIKEHARKLTAGFQGKAADKGKQDNTMPRAAVIKMTPRARLEFFKTGGRIEN